MVPSEVPESAMLPTSPPLQLPIIFFQQSTGAATTECQYTDSNNCQDTYYVVQDAQGNVTALYVRTDKGESYVQPLCVLDTEYVVLCTPVILYALHPIPLNPSLCSPSSSTSIYFNLPPTLTSPHQHVLSH